MMPHTPRKNDRPVRRPAAACAAWLLAGTVLAWASAGMAQSPEAQSAGSTGFRPTSSETEDASVFPSDQDQSTGAASAATTVNGAEAPANGLTGDIDPVDTESEDVIGGRLAVDADLARSNLREGSVDGLKSALDTSRDVPGISIGTFTLRPSIGQTFNSETTKSGGSKESRTYAETGMKGTLTSDWSRHQLTVTGEGYWQRNISGTGETKPSANIDAELKLDVSHDTTATLRAGYRFDREDATDPNAIADAETQSAVSQYTLGAGVEHDFGILRGSVKVDVDRVTYSDVELSDGTTLSQEDRNRNVGTVTARVGYELSPALVPGLEASGGRGRYDLSKDASGYARSYDTYVGRGGVEIDLGEKLKGELALGYGTYSFDDARLKTLNGLTVDGLISWSPQRGTDVFYGLSTALEPSTTSGESGALAYTLSSKMTHELRSALVARLSSTLTLRNYPSGSTSADQKVWTAGAGLTYDINRYLALTGDIGYERTTAERGPSTNIARIGIGLTLRR